MTDYNVNNGDGDGNDKYGNGDVDGGNDDFSPVYAKLMIKKRTIGTKAKMVV